MNIQTISAVNTQHYPVEQSQPQANSILNDKVSINELLSPEQNNTLQSYIDSKRDEQIEQVKSNYQTAKDIDLTRAYYVQQQKLFDIYLETATDGNIDTNNSSNNTTSAAGALNNAYSELYDLHQQVKGNIEQRPRIENPIEESMLVNSATVQLANTGQSLSQQQANAYNSVMMPSSNSYLHLSA